MSATYTTAHSNAGYFKPLSKARDQTCDLRDPTWVHYCWATMGTSLFCHLWIKPWTNDAFWSVAQESSKPTLKRPCGASTWSLAFLPWSWEICLNEPPGLRGRLRNLWVRAQSPQRSALISQTWTMPRNTSKQQSLGQLSPANMWEINDYCFKSLRVRTACYAAKAHRYKWVNNSDKIPHTRWYLKSRPFFLGLCFYQLWG